MNFIGIVALILSIIGMIIVGIGLYFMWQDTNSTSTRSTFWTVAGVGILLLTIILMIMAVIFKGNDQKKKEEKVIKRSKTTLDRILVNQIDAANQPAQPTVVQYKDVRNPCGVYRNECGDEIPYFPESAMIQQPVAIQQPVYAQAQREVVYVNTPEQQPIYFVEEKKSKEDRKQDKQIKEITNSLKELGQKLEGQRNNGQIIDREKEMRRNYKAQEAERNKQIEQLRNELNTVKQQRDLKVEEKKIEKKIEKRMEKRGLVPPNSLAHERVNRDLNRDLRRAGDNFVLYETPVQPLPYQGRAMVVPQAQNYQMYQTPHQPAPYNGIAVPAQPANQNEIAAAIAQGLPALQQAFLDPRFVQANANLVGQGANALNQLIPAVGDAVGRTRVNYNAQPLTTNSPFIVQLPDNSVAPVFPLGANNSPQYLPSPQPAPLILASPGTIPVTQVNQIPVNQVPMIAQFPNEPPVYMPTGNVRSLPEPVEKKMKSPKIKSPLNI